MTNNNGLINVVEFNREPRLGRPTTAGKIPQRRINVHKYAKYFPIFQHTTFIWRG